MKVYLDTSVVLRHLFNENDIWSHWGKWEEAYSSDLLGVEARRTIDRLRLALVLDDEGVVAAQREFNLIESAITILPCSRTIFQRASLPMPTAVRTLGALHLASALVLREQHTASLIVATHDGQLARGALALGFDVSGIHVGPVA